MKTNWIIIPLLLLATLTARAEGPWQVGVSSNLASWGTLAPNLGLEVYFADRFSVAADGSYGWWELEKNDSGFRSWSAGAEGRFWLKGDGAFTGHHFGVNVRYGKFDHVKKSIGRYGDALLAGITYGYNFRLAKNLHVDAGLGVGYIHADYTRYTYLPMDGQGDYMQLGKRVRNVPGLTDVHVSIIYRIPIKH